MKVRVTHFEDPNRVSRVSSRSFSNPGDVLEITRATRNSFASIDWHFRDYQPDICSRIPFDSQRLFAFTAIISFVHYFDEIIACRCGQSYFVEYRSLPRVSTQSVGLPINY